MNTPFFIAKRYLFSKKSQNVINIISGISIVGIMISTAAMIIVLSAFNGVEGLVINLFNSFESDIKIEAKHAKTFNKNFINDDIYLDDDIVNYSEVIEETVIIKNTDQYTFGTIKGVDEAFLKMVKMDDKLLDGESIIQRDGVEYGIVGVGLLQNVGGYIYQVPGQYDHFSIFSPNRNEKIKRNSTKPFQLSKIPISGTFSYNNKVDATHIIVPIDYASHLLAYNDDISGIEIDFPDDIDINQKKLDIQSKLGDDFKVTTAYEQNELLFKTSQSEKWLTIVILGFIFFLGTLNMIATLAMLVIEKQNNIRTFIAMGADEHQLHKIFFNIGLLINGLGILIGLIVGYIISIFQQKVGFLKMEGGMVEYFPIDVKLSDIIMILVITSIIGTIAAYVPSKILIKKMILNK